MRRELSCLFFDSIIIPLPSEASISTLTFFEIPRAAPLPVAIAFTIEIAPLMVALTTLIKLLQIILVS